MTRTPDQLPIRLHGPMNHFRLVCSCGRIIAQCRCPGPHPERVIPDGCAECDAAASTPEPAIVEPARCEACGRSSADFLTMAEVHERTGYARSNCPTCLLTDHPRIHGMDPRAC